MPLASHEPLQELRAEVDEALPAPRVRFPSLGRARETTLAPAARPRICLPVSVCAEPLRSVLVMGCSVLLLRLNSILVIERTTKLFSCRQAQIACIIRAAIAPTPADSANAKIATKIYINTLSDSERSHSDRILLSNPSASCASKRPFGAAPSEPSPNTLS